MGGNVTDIPRIVGPDEGHIERSGDAADRFLVEAAQTGGRVSLVEHRIPRGMLAAPLHMHTREDELSYVLQGRVGAVFDGEVVYAERGDLVWKPRGEWHTFWNAGDDELRILEIITPGGLEQAFKRLPAVVAEGGAEAVPGMAADFGCRVDLEQTMAIAQHHGLEF